MLRTHEQRRYNSRLAKARVRRTVLCRCNDHYCGYCNSAKVVGKLARTRKLCSCFMCTHDPGESHSDKRRRPAK